MSLERMPEITPAQRGNLTIPTLYQTLAIHIKSSIQASETEFYAFVPDFTRSQNHKEKDLPASLLS